MNVLNSLNIMRISAPLCLPYSYNNKHDVVRETLATHSIDDFAILSNQINFVTLF